jgi:tetratricopeptide (TPR) repeat protein
VLRTARRNEQSCLARVGQGPEPVHRQKLRVGDRLFQQGDPPVSRHRHGVNAYDFKARTLLSQGNKQAAIESYQAALKIDPTRDDLHALLGNIYTTEQRFEDAVASYEQAVTKNPTRGQSLFTRSGLSGDRPIR